MYFASGVNRWPWYAKSLDPDVTRLLQDYGVGGGRLLDLGTCSGSQAIALAKLGFEVTGTDVSPTALIKARENLHAEEGDLDVKFMLDDILETRLDSGQFDVILDRGCFHSIYAFGKERYIENVLKILGPQGMIFLKTMSADERRLRDRGMPQHFDRELLRNVFEDFFTIHEIRDSFFCSSNVKHPYRALLTILSRTP